MGLALSYCLWIEQKSFINSAWWDWSKHKRQMYDSAFGQIHWLLLPLLFVWPSQHKRWMDFFFFFFFYNLGRSVFGSCIRGKPVVRRLGAVHVLQCGLEAVHAVVELPRALQFLLGLVFVVLYDIGHFIERLREHLVSLLESPAAGRGLNWLPITDSFQKLL